jgi:hypothetical protein
MTKAQQYYIYKSITLDSTHYYAFKQRKRDKRITFIGKYTRTKARELLGDNVSILWEV